MPQAPNIQNNTQYVTDGLEIVSNSDAIHTRDDRGNLTLTSGSATNQAVIVENNYDSFTNRSFVNASKTAFNYFKFPPTRFYPSASLPDFTGLLDPADDVVDQTLTARYTLPYLGDPGGFGAETKEINTRTDTGWYYNGTSFNGSGGFRRIPVVGPNQVEEGAYVMSPEIIKLLRENNKTLEFDVTFGFVAPRNQGIFLRFGRATAGGNFRRFPDPGVPQNERYKLPSYTFYIIDQFGANNQPAGAAGGLNSLTTYPNIRFKYRVNVQDNAYNGPEQGTGEYDKFVFEAVSNNLDPSGNSFGQGAWVRRGDTAWQINVVDLPTDASGNPNPTPDFYGFREITFGSDCYIVDGNYNPIQQITYNTTPTYP